MCRTSKKVQWHDGLVFSIKVSLASAHAVLIITPIRSSVLWILLCLPLLVPYKVLWVVLFFDDRSNISGWFVYTWLMFFCVFSKIWNYAILAPSPSTYCISVQCLLLIWVYAHNVPVFFSVCWEKCQLKCPFSLGKLFIYLSDSKKLRILRYSVLYSLVSMRCYWTNGLWFNFHNVS